jgi:transposase-like protein
MLDPSASPGEWTRRTSELEGDGLTSTVRSSEQGRTVDFLLSEHRSIAAAKQFFTRAVARHGTPETITLDGYPATHAAVVELKQSGVLRPQTRVRTSKYLNNIVEQDHRRVKPSIYPMLGCKSCRTAAVTISRIELGQKIRKG